MEESGQNVVFRRNWSRKVCRRLGKGGLAYGLGSDVGIGTAFLTSPYKYFWGTLQVQNIT